MTSAKLLEVKGTVLQIPYKQETGEYSPHALDEIEPLTSGKNSEIQLW